MLNFADIKKYYPFAFKKLQEHHADGIGGVDVKEHDYYGTVLWYFGDTPDLDRRVNDYELYEFFDENGIYVIVKMDMNISKVGQFLYDVHSYDSNGWIGEVDQKSFYGRDRKNTEIDAFNLAFEILNDKLRKIQKNETNK